MKKPSTTRGSIPFGASGRRPRGRRRPVLAALAACAAALVSAGPSPVARAAEPAPAAGSPPPLETLDAEDPAAVVAATRGLVLVDLYAEW